MLATTTSSLPVIECAAATSRPSDVIGMHFFNPAAIMKLVEVVSTVSTAADVEATVLDVTRKIGKHAVRCGDRAGFIVNALLFPYLNDAIKMLEAHYATADDIDSAMKVGCGYPMGPFELLDVVGNDVSLAIERELYLEFREPGFAPAPLLEHLVTAGRLGRKTGKGFRDYTEPTVPRHNRRRIARRAGARGCGVSERREQWRGEDSSCARCPGRARSRPTAARVRPGDPAGLAARRDLAGATSRIAGTGTACWRAARPGDLASGARRHSGDRGRRTRRRRARGGGRLGRASAVGAAAVALEPRSAPSLACSVAQVRVRVARGVRPGAATSALAASTMSDRLGLGVGAPLLDLGVGLGAPAAQVSSKSSSAALAPRLGRRRSADSASSRARSAAARRRAGCARPRRSG